MRRYFISYFFLCAFSAEKCLRHVSHKGWKEENMSPKKHFLLHVLFFYNHSGCSKVFVTLISRGYNPIMYSNSVQIENALWRVTSRKPLLTRHQGWHLPEQKACGREEGFCALTRPERSFLAVVLEARFAVSQTLRDARNTTSTPWSGAAAASR